MNFANDEGDLTLEERTLRAAERLAVGGGKDGKSGEGGDKPQPTGDPPPDPDSTIKTGGPTVGRAVLQPFGDERYSGPNGPHSDGLPDGCWQHGKT